MLLPYYLTALTGAASLVSASGYVNLDIIKRTAEPGSRRLGRRQDIYGTLNNDNGSEYLIAVEVGTPGQRLMVTLDTGSSDLWVPSTSTQACKSGKCINGDFNPSDSSTYNILEKNGFNITYGIGTDAGNWVSDSVSVAGSTTLKNVTLAVALEGDDNTGIMGIGYSTDETIPNPDGNGTYPTVTDHMVSQGLINRPAYSLFLNNLNESDGSICFGCVDSTKYNGELVALPLQLGPRGTSPTPNRPNAFYVTLTDVTFIDAVGAETRLSPEGYAQSALLDSGTTQTLINNDILSQLVGGLGGVYIGDQSFLVPCAYANTNATIRYTFGGSDGPSITVPLSETIYGQEVPSEDYSAASGGCNMGFGTPVDGIIILGDTFLRNAYIVYDLDNYQVAMAQANTGPLGSASSSSLTVISSGTSIPGVSRTASASGTQQDYAQATAEPTGISVVPSTATYASALSPTFNLGAEATSSGAEPTATEAVTASTSKNPGSSGTLRGTATGSGSSSSGAAVVATGVPQAALWGVVAAGALLI